MDLKRPSLDGQMRALTELEEHVKERCRIHVEAAQREVQEASRALQTIDGSGIVAAAAHCWVRELDFRDIDKTYQNIRARIEINIPIKDEP